LIFDAGVGAQQSEAEKAVEEEQAVDVWFFAVTIVEKRYFDAEHLSDQLQPRRADPIETPFVFLHLLNVTPSLSPSSSCEMPASRRRKRIRRPISMSASPADRGLSLVDFGFDFLRIARSSCNPKAMARAA
jgi:hypothetical protein